MVGRAGLLWPGDGSIGGRLETERLRLLPPRRGDLEALDDAILETLPELVQWLPWATLRHDRSETRRYIRGRASRAVADWQRNTAWSSARGGGWSAW